jgi:aminoglycoside 2''-phosphotransferase
MFRFPRTEGGRQRLALELSLLSKLAPALPLAIPKYSYFSNETNHYAGYAMIPGRALRAAQLGSLPAEQQNLAADALGTFLSALHSFSLDDLSNEVRPPQQIPQDWLSFRDAVLEKASSHLSHREREWVRTLFGNYMERWGILQPRCLIHADFTDDHILFNSESGKISGIIDFGDVCIGDPAYDLAGVMLSYGWKFLQRVLQTYQVPLDEEWMARIEQFYLPKVSLHQLLYGIEMKDYQLIESARQSFVDVMDR